MSDESATPDWKQLSLFEAGLPTAREIRGGLVATLGAVLLLPIVVIGTTALVNTLREAAGIEQPTEEPEVPPVEVIQARFVRLGAELDPRQLPDRYVPSRATAPQVGPVAPVVQAAPEAAPAPAEVAPPVPTTPTGPAVAPPEPAPATPEPTSTARREPRPTTTPSQTTTQQVDSAEDALARLGDRADALTTLATPRQREGDPSGIPEGTETRDNGDLYLGQLYTFFRRGWQADPDIPDAELRTLSCVVQVTLTADGRVGAWRIQTSSGNDGFDRSVSTRMRQTEGSALPPPPADVADRYLGHSISLRFLGRNGR
ncbi:MAG: TonB family protein [Sandaracinaceae bacterium]|nr:TonB family protein [Sandaracinaceae bacterium]